MRRLPLERGVRRMKHDASVLALKQPCPVCEQGELIFLTCPVCEKVVVACNEEGSLFPTPTELATAAPWSCDVWISATTKCPHCNAVHEFRLSTETEIHDAGVLRGHYFSCRQR